MKLTTVTIEDHPKHAKFSVEVPEEYTVQEAKDYINKLPLDDLLAEGKSAVSEESTQKPEPDKKPEPLKSFDPLTVARKAGFNVPDMNITELGQTIAELLGPGADVKMATDASANIMEAVKSGNMTGTATGIAEMVAGLAAVVIPGNQAGVIKGVQKRGKTIADILQQGGSLSSKPGLAKIERSLEDRGFAKMEPHEIDKSKKLNQIQYEDKDTGKIVTEEWHLNKMVERKTFGEETSLRTYRNWWGE